MVKFIIYKQYNNKINFILNEIYNKEFYLFLYAKRVVKILRDDLSLWRISTSQNANLRTLKCLLYLPLETRVKNVRQSHRNGDARGKTIKVSLTPRR